MSGINKAKENVRIEFRIPMQTYIDDFEPYIETYLDRHRIAYEAFKQYVSHRKGRDKKRRKEQLISDANLLNDAVVKILEDRGVL